MAAITLNEFMQRATADSFRWHLSNGLDMKLVQKTTGTTFPASYQAISGSVTEIGTQQVRLSMNEVFTATANWGTIDRVQLLFDGDSGTDTWKIKLRDTSNTDNATEVALSAANWTLTIRYLYVEYKEQV